jgi:uncharacterized damage-inducible protein DinB
MQSAFLDAQREAVMRKLDGISEEDARRRLGPSSTSLLGIVKHLAYVERSWFQAVFKGRTVEDPWSEADPDVDWRIEDWESVDGLLEFYGQEIAVSRKITRKAKGMGQKAARPDRVGLETVTLRWIMSHMIEETARHAGHADIIREMIDGETGL